MNLSAHVKKRKTFKTDVKNENVSGAKPSQRQRLIQVLATCHTIHSFSGKQTKGNKCQSGDMFSHVTSVDGFKEIKSEKSASCQPDPQQVQAFSPRSMGEKVNCQMTQFLVPHSQ